VPHPIWIATRIYTACTEVGELAIVIVFLKNQDYNEKYHRDWPA
jgi:hypothetical protein